MTFRKQPGVTFWATVVLVGYPLSFGPACWLCEQGVLGQRNAWLLYRPITWTWWNGPPVVHGAIGACAGLFGDKLRFFMAQGRPYLEKTSKSPLDYEICSDDQNRSK